MMGGGHLSPGHVGDECAGELAGADGVAPRSAGTQIQVRSGWGRSREEERRGEESRWRGLLSPRISLVFFDRTRGGQFS